jgi:formate dehydrogenase subunit gamma
MRLLALLTVVLSLALPVGDAAAQGVVPPDGAVTNATPAAPGTLDSLDDILARQRGEGDAREPRDLGSAADNATALGQQLGLQAGPSDSDLWSGVRHGNVDVTVSAGGDPARVIVQDGGMAWLEFREGPLRTYGGWLLLATIGFLVVFYLVRGRMPIDHGRAGWTILRFTSIERFAHWLLAVSFLILGATGLFVLFGRNGLMDWLGKENYATLAGASKWVHNNVSWAFMLSIVMIFVMWVWHNLPSRTDLTWLRHGGGFFGGEHPPAKKFNLGQKLIFWSVVVLGGSISASGLSLLFPYELPMFAKTFSVMNDMGLPSLVGMEAFPATLTPQEEMQFAQAWHSIVSFVLLAIIIAHIYIGSIGMEGAFAAMGSGRVDANWAREHHSIWAEKKIAEGEDVQPRTDGAPPMPAE